MKINVHGGHNKHTPGAKCILDELSEDRKVKNKVIALLKQEGHTVYDCTDDAGKNVNENLYNIVKKCNSHVVDLDVSIHLNSGRNDKKGDGSTGGVEVWIYAKGNKAEPYAERICKNIANALKVHNRGVKVSGNNLYIPRFTKAPAVLIECVFVDDRDDAKCWNVDKCAKAIVEGIFNKRLDDKPKPAPKHVEKRKTDKIVVDGYWGVATTKKAQKVFKTTVDGIVSNQCSSDIIGNLGLQSSSWKWSDHPDDAGSQLIKAIQDWVDAKQDGFAGKETFKKMQQKLGTTQDGVVSGPSQMVKAFQRWLNEQ